MQNGNDWNLRVGIGSLTAGGVAILTSITRNALILSNKIDIYRPKRRL